MTFRGDQFHNLERRVVHYLLLINKVYTVENNNNNPQ